MALVASSDILTSLGSKVFWPNASIFLPGYPFITFLICTIIGRFASLNPKYKSTLVINAPPSSSHKKVWASGSNQPVNSLSVFVWVVLVFWFTLSCTNVPFLVAIIVSCSVSKVPVAW